MYLTVSFPVSGACHCITAPVEAFTTTLAESPGHINALLGDDRNGVEYEFTTTELDKAVLQKFTEVSIQKYCPGVFTHILSVSPPTGPKGPCHINVPCPPVSVSSSESPGHMVPPLLIVTTIFGTIAGLTTINAEDEAEQPHWFVTRDMTEYPPACTQMLSWVLPLFHIKLVVSCTTSSTESPGHTTVAPVMVTGPSTGMGCILTKIESLTTSLSLSQRFLRFIVSVIWYQPESVGVNVF